MTEGVEPLKILST